MAEQFVFFYLMKPEAEKISHLVPEHIRYWETNKPTNYNGGPFGDKSGGLIVFEADDLDIAKKMVADDPFVKNRTISAKWVKSWLGHR